MEGHFTSSLVEKRHGQDKAKHEKERRGQYE